MSSELPVLGKDVIRQRHLEQILRRIFPNENISANVRSEGELRYPVTGQFLELDIWLPSLELCFEFQDSYHYIATTYSHKPLEKVQAKDNFKQQGIRYKGATLLQVPCWWDGKIESLEAEVSFHRPDLIENEPNQENYIPLNPTDNFFILEGIPNVGELMLASFPTDPKFTTYISPSSPWWLGEKYDGIRFCWNSHTEKIYARSGGVLKFPRPFYRRLPKGVFLDGEIWFGRGSYSEAQKIFLKVDFENVAWPFLRIVAFDDPSFPARHMTFEKRYKRVILSIKPAHPFAVNAPRMLHDNNPKKRKIAEITQHILEDGGEGIILRKPRSIYESGRSTNLLKLKATRADREALVVSVEGDSYKLQLPDGDTFLVQDQISDGPKPKKGDVVTFEFDYGTRSVGPANPAINRIRKDLSWEEVLRDHERDAQLNDHSLRMAGTTQYTTPAGFWTSEKGKNMRAELEKFARNMGFDPLIADHWYRVPRQTILGLPISATVQRRYKGSFMRALLDVFPDIGLDPTKFAILPHHYWKNTDNRRNFLIEAARSKGFEPLVAESWYSRANRTSLLSEKRVLSVMEMYGNNFADALAHLFPEIGINPSKFASLPYNHWEMEQNRKDLFSNFAKGKGMDPLLPDTWYFLMRATALDIKDSATAIHHYEGDVAKALVTLFPDIRLDLSHLYSLQDLHWREFIAAFIDERKFDPLLADNWYQMTRDKIVEVGEGDQKVIHHNRNKFVNEVMRAFPNIGLDITKFSLLNNEYTRDAISRRRFFERFAKKRGFNPKTPENWYPIQRTEFMKEKGAFVILTHYGGSFVKGLMQIFPEIGLQAHKFATMSKNFWQSAENRREFLATTAKTRFGVDPSSAEHWYHLERGAFITVKGLNSVLAYHSGDLVKALQELFPELKLDSSKFYQVPSKFWQDAANRRKFFINFAEINKFDPLLPGNWYTVSKEKFLATKGAAKVLEFHEKNYVTALLSLFPDIGLSAAEFPAIFHFKPRTKFGKT